MIKFYYHPSPNPAKVALLLEELELQYETVPVDTRKGEQHSPDFLAINPNAKTPALTDGDAVLFDSNAILLYLADKHQKFAPGVHHQDRAQMLAWLMFIATGVGPYSGQYFHFNHIAPEPKAYALNRYEFEAERHWKILDSRLAGQRFLVGDSYSIVDMAMWGWGGPVPYLFGENGWDKFPNAKRLYDEISARPAAQRAGALATEFSFKQDFDETAVAALFPQNARLAAI